MRNVNRLLPVSFAIFLALFLSSCNNGLSSDYRERSRFTLYGVSARVSEARAIALGNSSVSSAELIGINDISRSDTNATAMFSILEDGAIVSSLDFRDNQRPEIRFTAVSPTGYIFVQMHGWDYRENLGLFAINAETNEIYAPNFGEMNGTIKTWFWNHGTLRARPIVFRQDGRAYFVVSLWDGIHSHYDRIVSWHPNEDSVRLETLEIDGVSIERFQVDGTGRIYMSGHISNVGLQGGFLQVFDPRTPRGRYVYLGDETDGWVRGYVASGNNIIMNGHNILGGYDGIIRLISSIDADNEIDFSLEVIYDNNTVDWFRPRYDTWFDHWSGQTVHTGLLENFQDSGSKYRWPNYWRSEETTSGLDEERILEFVRRFYVEDITIDFANHTSERVYSRDEVYGPGTGQDINYWYWLEENVTRAEFDNEPAVTFYRWRQDIGISWLSFSDISDMNYLGDGTLWGIYSSWGGNHPTVWVRLLDSAGRRDLVAHKTRNPNGDDVGASLIQFSDDQMFYRYRGQRIGTHRIASMDREGNVKDITKNVEDIGFITIFDYSVGDNWLYFSGSDGIEKLAGRINLTTLEYSRIESGTTLTSIDVIR